MYEQLRQEAADRDGMITKEDKAQEKAADIERMKRRLLESNKSTDPRLVPGIVSQISGFTRCCSQQCSSF
jgi:fructose-bisphosphate aldolase class 1